MAPQVLEHPGTRPTANREREVTVDTKSISPAGDGFYAAAKYCPNAHDETVETHYAALERADCPFCFRGYVTITVEEDGEEYNEAVPCKPCEQATAVRMDEERTE